MTQRRTSGLLFIRFLVLFCSVAAAACSSGSKSSATGAAGSVGSAGATAGTSGGAAGTSGDAAAGSIGSTGAAGATADGGAGSDANACPFAASLASPTVTMQVAVEGGDRSTTPHDGSIAWLGQTNDATEPDMLDVQLYKNTAPFGASLASMSIPLTGQDNFATCGACVLFHPQHADGVEIRAQKNYIAKSGTLNITAVPNGTAVRFTATLSNVVFEHVMIDSSFVTTKLDDCTITLTAASIDAPVTPAP